MPGYGQITPDQLFRLVGTPDAPLLIDVRLPEDVALDPRRLPTAQAARHDAVAAYLRPNARAVVICQAGRKLSEGAAALLRSHGMAAEVLAGGHAA